jgi:3-oxo-5-alpha-steroid 4-dehydrogenase 3
VSIATIEFSKPSIKTIFGVPLFITASSMQHDCHVYLASLKKYTLPDHGLFKLVLCPHYTSECFIYLALAIAGAPEGHVLNRTWLMVLFFSVANLGVTADSTREWYGQKFGADRIKGRWRMIPFVF